MKFNFEETKIYIRPGATDLRKGVGGLLAVIENEMKLDALTDSVFLFCNKSHKLLKLIFWDKTGFWLARSKETHGHGQTIQRKQARLHQNR